MRIPIMNLDSLGIIEDVQPHDLPINAWSGGKNVRFVNRRVEKTRGFQPSFTPTIDANFLMPVLSPAGFFWLLASNAKVQNSTNNTITDITRAAGGDYTAVGQMWTGGSLNGVPVLNNFNDIPQQWVPATQVTDLTSLSNWPTLWRARSLRPFKNYLVALGTKKDADDNPFRVNWSHVADPGAVPDSWDITDATKDAGEVTLADTDGTLVDQLQMRGVNILYKTDSCYTMRHIGGNDIFAFERILGDGHGLLTPNAVKRFLHNGEHHLVFGQADVYAHNGINAQSILRGKMRDWLFNTIDAANVRSSFVAHNIDMHEMWVCFPQTGSLLPNMAIVWNYLDNTTTVRDLNNVAFMANGRVTEVSSVAEDTWDNATGDWDSENTSWGHTQFLSGGGNKLLSVTHGAGRKADIQDATSMVGGAVMEAMVERIGLNVLGKDYQGNPIFDTDSIKIVTEVWPRLRGPVGTVIDVYVGVQDKLSDPVTWEGPLPFTIGVDEKVDPYCSGKAISIRFSNTSDVHWDCAGYDLEIVPGGR